MARNLGQACALETVFFAVAKWPVTGQGFQNNKWPAVPYSQWISQIEKIQPFWTIVSRDPDQTSWFVEFLYHAFEIYWEYRTTGHLVF